MFSRSMVVVICLIVFDFNCAQTAEIYVSPNTASDGTGSADRPCRTLAQAARRAHKGDTIHLGRGLVYRESEVNIDGATVVADGPAEQPAPVISGALAISGFKPSSDNGKIFAAPCPQKPMLCATNGKLLTLARFPNEGFLSTRDGTTANTIVDPDLAKRASGPHWTGAQLHWRKWSWWWETRNINSDDGGRLQLGPTPVKDLENLVGIGSAYYVDDCRSELDAPGEWWYDSAAKQLLVIPPAGVDSSKLIVEAVVEKTALHLSNATLRGITIRHYAGTAVVIGRTSVVEDCVFDQIWDTGVGTSWDSSGSAIKRCVFSDVLNVGISWIENPDAAGGSVIEHNRFDRIGMRDGLGGSGPWHASGIIINNGKAVCVRLNTLADIGYCGVILSRDGQVVERNIFIRCMSTMNDGAAIYTNCSFSSIRENIVLNSIGNLHTSQPFYPLGHGIWPEFLNQFHDTKIVGNTIVGCGGNGIFMPNNFTCEIRDNVLAGNRMAGLALGTSNNIRKAQGHTIAGNVFVVDPRLRPKLGVSENIPANWMGNDHPCAVSFEPGIDYGSMSGSTYVMIPGSAVAHAGGKPLKDPAAFKADAAWSDPAPKVLPTQAMLLINDTEQPAEIPVPAGAWGNLNGERAGSTVHVEPFRSAVLLSGSALPPSAPAYVLASGRDFSPGAEQDRASSPLAVAKSKKSPDHPVIGNSVAPAAKETVGAPKPESLALFTKRLRERTIAAIAEKHPPRFMYSILRSEIEVASVDGHGSIRLPGENSTMDANIFEKLGANDALALSRALLNKDNPDDHALVAFFAFCTGNSILANEHLGFAGSAGLEVKAAFAAK